MPRMDILLIAAVAIAAYSTPESYGVDGPVTEGRTGRRISQFVKTAHERLGFSGAVLAATGGNVVSAVAAGGVGESDQTTTTLFEVASCTKPMTAIVVFRLQEQGKLSIDDPLSRHLPNVPENCAAITIRHLLQHTSGIPGTNTDGRGDDLAAVIPTFLDGGPRNTPGSKHEYWNQGYSLLSEVIARASGKSYVDAMRDELFEPAGMTSSCFTGDDGPSGVTVAMGTSSFGAPRTALEHPYGSYGFQYRGMGGVVTNVWDLWRLDRALTGERLLSSKSYAAMTDPGGHPYALGWRVGKTPAGTPSHHHSGKVRGFVADLRRYPTEDGLLVVLVNFDGGMTTSLVTTAVEQMLFDQRPEISLPEPLRESFQDAIVGRYTDSKSRPLTITADQSRTTIKIEWGGPVTQGTLGKAKTGMAELYMFQSFNPLKYGPNDQLKFRMGADGKANAVGIMNLKPPLVFERVNE